MSGHNDVGPFNESHIVAFIIRNRFLSVAFQNLSKLSSESDHRLDRVDPSAIVLIL